jgi:AcrB/AcrD/AcrF family
VRSALVAIITLPIAIIMSFIPLYGLGLTSNIMSLGGIAIAIGAMIDAAIIMVENAHKALEHFKEEHGHDPTGQERFEVIVDAAKSVGRPLFFFAPCDHSEFHSGVFAGGSGRTFVPAASLHQNVFDVLRCNPGDNPDSAERVAYVGE